MTLRETIAAVTNAHRALLALEKSIQDKADYATLDDRVELLHSNLAECLRGYLEEHPELVGVLPADGTPKGNP
jgi:hypothetical protein